MRHPEIDLSVGRQVIGVGKAGAKSATVDHRGGKARAVPQIGSAGRGGQGLGVVGIDIMGGDIGERVGIEQILVRDHVGGELLSPCNVPIDLEIAVGVGGLELDADILRPVIVETAQHIGGAELAVVEQVSGDLVVAVDADFEAGDSVYFLIDADIEHVRPLRQNRIVGGNGRLLRRVLRQRQIGRGSDHLRWRREVSRIAGVERGSLVWLPGQADARAELVGIDILIHLVEPQSRVQGQLVGDPPLVLKIGADQPAGLRT